MDLAGQPNSLDMVTIAPPDFFDFSRSLIRSFAYFVGSITMVYLVFDWNMIKYDFVIRYKIFYVMSIWFMKKC
jgi:hypothetical protein